MSAYNAPPAARALMVEAIASAAADAARTYARCLGDPQTPPAHAGLHAAMVGYLVDRLRREWALLAPAIDAGLDAGSE
jgi:hypothetical protein